NYGAGASVFNLTMELIKRVTGADIRYVAYRGSMPTLSALMTGEVQVAVDVIQTPLPFLRDGRMRGLAVTGATRATAAPDIPTLAEAGIPDVQVTAWTGLYVPAGTPPAIIALLDDAIRH